MPSEKGFGTIDVLFALGVMGLMIGAYARQETENYSHRRADSIANSTLAVMDASRFYIGNNYNALLSHLNVGQTMEIPLINQPNFMGIGDLATNSALLPSGFTGKVAKGQTLHLLLKHIAPTAGKPDYISGMVMTTGGANLTDREVGLAVNDMGLSGGGVMSRPPMGHTNNKVYGGYGTWSYPVSQWQASGITPSVGHIAMVTDSFSLPTGDYLSRYNGNNPESIRLHTDLDMGNDQEMGHQLSGVHAIFGANNQDTRLQDTYHSGRVNFGNGGIACENDSMGCHFDIGTKGGFYDNEDGWISFQNNSPTLGLKNSESTDVLGATLDNDILTRDGVSYSFSAGGAPGQGQDAALTYGGGWINATGGNGFQGLSAYLMQAQRFQDRNDNSYYFIPSQLSRLNELQLAGQVATDGYEFKGGVHTRDLYAGNTLNTGNANGQSMSSLTANGNGYIGGNATIAWNIKTQGTVSSDGLDASNPQAWDSLSHSGGMHVAALKSSGGSIFMGSNYSGYAGSALLNQSKAEVAGIAKASVFRTRGPKPVSGTPCTGNITAHNPYTDNYIGDIINEQIKDNTPKTYQNGDIASDASGQPLSCVNGVWKPLSNTLFSTFNGCNTASQWTNTSGQPEFVSAYSNTVNNDSDTLSMTLVAPTGQTYLVSSSDDPSDGGVKRYTVDGFVPNGWSAHVDSTIGVAGVCHWGGNVPGANNPTSLPDVPNAPDPTPVTPPAPVTPIPNSVYDDLKCYAFIVPLGNNNIRAMLRCGALEKAPGLPYFIGPKVLADIYLLNSNGMNGLSFPKTWIENYGIKTSQIYLLNDDDHVAGDTTDIDLTQYPSGSIISFLPIENPEELYTMGEIDWENVKNTMKYEKDLTGVNALTSTANNQSKLYCITSVNDPAFQANSPDLRRMYEFPYDANAPFACGNN